MAALVFYHKNKSKYSRAHKEYLHTQKSDDSFILIIF